VALHIIFTLKWLHVEENLEEGSSSVVCRIVVGQNVVKLNVVCRNVAASSLISGFYLELKRFMFNATFRKNSSQGKIKYINLTCPSVL